MSKHTQEPWVLFEVGDRHVHFCPGSATDKTSVLTVTEEDGVSFAAVYNDDDARRIVACVNACRGLPTDELEQKGLVVAVGTKLLELEQQQDELIVALKATLAAMNYGGPVINNMDVVTTADELRSEASRLARKAIAKAKGGAA